MSAFCACETVDVDVKRTYQTEALDASIGREARLRGSPREGPECEPKPPFQCEHRCPFANITTSTRSVHADDDCGAYYKRPYAISIRVPVPPFSSRPRWYSASASAGDSPTNAAKAATAPGPRASTFANPPP